MIYLVASNVRPSDVGRTLGHEIIGHKGLRSVFGENFNTILDSVYNSHAEEIINYARTYNRDTETIANRRYLTEEFLSDCADLKVKPSWWKEFIASLRQMLRRIFPKMRISDADINGWLSKAHRAVQQQSPLTRNNNGVRYAVEGSQGKAVRFLEENGKIIPIAEGFDFDKTANMQQAMQDYISLLDGEHFTIKEDNTDVYFDKNSATEYARSKDTSRLRNHKSKLFKAKAKAVSAVGSIVENAAGGRDEVVKAGHSKEGKKGKYRRYDVEFGLPSGINEVKVYTGELVIWNPEKGNSTFYDITNINFSRKVRDIANTIDTTGARLKDGTTPHQLPANGDTLSQLPEKSSENSEKMRFSVAPQVDTPEFKNWFGNSKVVDENGKPLVNSDTACFAFQIYGLR